MTGNERYQAGKGIDLLAHNKEMVALYESDEKTVPTENYLDVNHNGNRADRHGVKKLRGTPKPGVTGTNHRQRVLEWQRQKFIREYSITHTEEPDVTPAE
jgi:hypothetical protein